MLKTRGELVFSSKLRLWSLCTGQTPSIMSWTFFGDRNYNCKSRFFLSFGKTTISVNEGEEYIAKTLGSCKLYVLWYDNLTARASGSPQKSLIFSWLALKKLYTNENFVCASREFWWLIFPFIK